MKSIFDQEATSDLSRAIMDKTDIGQDTNFGKVASLSTLFLILLSIFVML